MGLNDFTLYDVIVRNAQLYEQSPAWHDVDQGVPHTFGQIKTSVDRLAFALQKVGCQKGDRIGVLGKNCLEYFLIYGAAAALGAIVLPVNWRLTADEITYILNDGTPRWVFADPYNPEWVDAVFAKVSNPMRMFNLRPNKGPFDNLEIQNDISGFTPASAGWDDDFVIVYTAAVDGHPRGALLSQGNLLCAHMHLAHAMALTFKDAHISALPLYHVAGLFMALCAFHCGCLNLNLAKFDAGRIVKLIAEQKATFMLTFAPMLKSILDVQKQTNADIRSLRAVMGLDTSEEIERYQNISGGSFYCVYGQTETSMLASVGKYNQAPGSAGRPIMLGALQLIDDNDQSVDIGEIGEITMRGPLVFKGYWGLEDVTRHTFRNGWHHTGDLGYIDKTGFLWYAGRKTDKELIKPGGENVYPMEIEKVVLDHPDIADVVVFGVPDPKWKEGIKAVCVLSKGAELDPQELIDFVGQRIASYKKPQYVEFVNTLPLQSDGTIDREKVKQMYGGS